MCETRRGTESTAPLIDMADVQIDQDQLEKIKADLVNIATGVTKATLKRKAFESSGIHNLEMNS